MPYTEDWTIRPRELPPTRIIEGIHPRETVTAEASRLIDKLGRPLTADEPGHADLPAGATRCWRFRDEVSGAIAVMWDLPPEDEPDELNPMPLWACWWRDGVSFAGSGRKLIEHLLDDAASVLE